MNYEEFESEVLDIVQNNTRIMNNVDLIESAINDSDILEMYNEIKIYAICQLVDNTRTDIADLWKKVHND